MQWKPRFNRHTLPSGSVRTVSTSSATIPGKRPTRSGAEAVATEPQTVLDRRSGRWDNLQRALPLIDPKAREKMFFRIYGLNDRGGDESTGVISGPQQDGDCDHPPFGREDAWWKGPPGRPFPICGSEPLARGKGKH
jgi:hypothetical protein